MIIVHKNNDTSLNVLQLKFKRVFVRQNIDSRKYGFSIHKVKEICENYIMV